MKLFKYLLADPSKPDKAALVTYSNKLYFFRYPYKSGSGFELINAARISGNKPEQTVKLLIDIVETFAK